MPELPMLHNRPRRWSRPPLAESGGLRMIRLVDLRRLHLLLALVILMETADLALTIWRLGRG